MCLFKIICNFDSKFTFKTSKGECSKLKSKEKKITGQKQTFACLGYRKGG